MKRIIYLALATAIIPFLASCDKSDSSATATLTASPASVTIPAEGGQVNVVLQTNQDTFTYSGEADWLTVTVDGKALSLSAEGNPVQEPRSCTLSVTAGDRTIQIPVTQEAASKYPGYTEITTLDEALYSGTLLQMMGSAPEDSEGGQAYMYFTIDSRTSLTMEFFTPIFTSADEVYLPEGKYFLGTDLSDGASYAAVPFTFVRGTERIVDEDTEDEEIFQLGTYFTNTVNDIATYDLITDGSFTVSENEDGSTLVLIDFKDASGKEYKYYYEGELVLNGDGAFYPSEDTADPTAVSSANCTYNGAAGDAGDLCNLTLTLSTAAFIPSTTVSFNMEYADFSSDLDISGTYSSIAEPMSAIGINKGSQGEFAPEYSYIIMDMTFTNFFIADGDSEMTITRNQDGTYDIKATLASTAGDRYEYDVQDVAIEIYDGTATYEEE